MNCELGELTIHGYFDGELDAVRAAEYEEHLKNCSECQISLEHMRSLRSQFREAELYERASPRVSAAIRKRLALEAPAGPPGLSWPRRMLMPAFAVLALTVALSATLFLVQRRAETRQIAFELVDAHVRSLQPGHLMDVQSTDQHTVKPWFDGKLAFIPPVTDFSGQGFPLLGGRLDIAGGNSVAALVYGRRKHIINMFVWPRGSHALQESSGSRQGYNWIVWHSGEMQFCLVSDVSPSDLHELEALVGR